MTRSSSSIRGVVSPPVDDAQRRPGSGSRKKSRWKLPQRSRTATGPISAVGAGNSLHAHRHSPSLGGTGSGGDNGGFAPQLGALLAPTPEMLQSHKRTLSNVSSRMSTPRASVSVSLAAVQETGIVFPKLRRTSHTLPKAAVKGEGGAGATEEGVGGVKSQPSTLQRVKLTHVEPAEPVVFEDRLSVRIPSQEILRPVRKRSDTGAHLNIAVGGEGGKGVISSKKPHRKLPFSKYWTVPRFKNLQYTDKYSTEL